MGLKDKLANQGSNLTKHNGSTPADMPGASKQSKLHDEYSLNGNPFQQKKPAPSDLDLNGVKPTGPLNDPGYGTINDSFSKGEYLNNLPG